MTKTTLTWAIERVLACPDLNHQPISRIITDARALADAIDQASDDKPPEAREIAAPHFVIVVSDGSTGQQGVFNGLAGGVMTFASHPVHAIRFAREQDARWMLDCLVLPTGVTATIQRLDNAP